MPEGERVKPTELKSQTKTDAADLPKLSKEELEKQMRNRITRSIAIESKDRIFFLKEAAIATQEKSDTMNYILDVATKDSIKLYKHNENNLDSITDENLREFLKIRLRLNKSEVPRENIKITEDVLVLRGEKYFQNWPMLTFLDESEIKGHDKAIVFLSESDCLGLVVDLTKKSESGKYARYNFAYVGNILNKHKTVISKENIKDEIFTIEDYEGLDKRQMYIRLTRDFAVIDSLLDEGMLKADKYVEKATFICFYLDIFLNGKKTEDGLDSLEIDLQDFLTLVTIGRRLSIFNLIERAFDFDTDDKGDKYLICDETKILKLTFPLDKDKAKPGNDTEKDMVKALYKNIDYAAKTVLLIKPKEFFDTPNPISGIDKTLLTDYENIIISDGNLPGKIAVSHIIDQKCRTFGFGYLDYKLEVTDDKTEIDLTGKINKDNFCIASNPSLDLSYLFFILEAFTLERKLMSFGEVSTFNEVSDFKDVQSFVMAMLDTAKFRDDCKTELDGYINFLTRNLDFTLNDFLKLCDFNKISNTWLEDKTIYEFGLSKLKNRRVVEMTMVQDDQSSKVLAQILSRKILTIDEMPEKTKIGIMGRLKKLISTDGNQESNQKQKDAVDQILAIPYGKYAKDNSIDEVIKYLDENLYGMDFTKKQVLQFLAKHKLNSKASPKTLCLVGNPGVGKTYFCQQFSQALNRPFFKIGIGGLNDSAILNGSNPVYVGSDSGYIAKSMIQNQVMNPVVILDEIDKIGNTASTSRNGIQSAFLEILDPMQNSAVRDNFLQIELDLSQIWFVATANDVNAINPALIDRMEVIEIQDYSLDDKIHIFDKIVWPRNQQESGLVEFGIVWDPKAKEEFIASINEPGIRSLDKKISSLCGSLALDVVSKKVDLSNFVLDYKYITSWEADWEINVSKNKIGFELN